MGKVTPDVIRIRLTQTIRNNWKTLEWKGINLGQTTDIDKVEAVLRADFQYSGKDTYDFYAHIRFLETYPDNKSEQHIQSYETVNGKMEIEESNDDFTITIASPIILQRI